MSMLPVFVITLGDVVGLSLLALILVVGAVWLLVRCVQVRLCKHDQGVGETQACDAICNKCGANLGFIDDWRKSGKSP